MTHVSPRQFTFVALLLALFGVACDPAAPTAGASISPSGPITLLVGQTAEIVYVGPYPGSATSSNPYVATVGADRDPAVSNRSVATVTCVRAGTMTVNFLVGLEGGYLGTFLQVQQIEQVSVTCVASGGPVNLIQVAPATLNFEHIIGTSPCPQLVGTILVTNVAGTSVDVTVTTTNLALTASVANFSLAAGATREVTVSFNCGTQTSFVGQITIAGRSGDTIDAEAVTVNGNVHP